MTSSSPVHVAAAVVFDAQGRVLIARRPEHLHQGGLWEFPGGKVEAGETVQQALWRELHEEVGIDIDLRATRPLIRVPHDYPDKSVLLDVWWVDAFNGTVHGREGQPCEWVAIETLDDYAFPAANRPIIHAIKLPRDYLITPEPGPDHLAFLERLHLALESGVSLVQLRAKTLSAKDYEALAIEVISLCRSYQARILLNAPSVLVEALDADGVHLSAAAMRGFTSRPLGPSYWVGASCHNQSELDQAKKLGVDFAVLGPVKATASHPDAIPLGWTRFQELADRASFPVYALGGLSRDDLQEAGLRGAQGIAAIRGLWPQ